MKLVFTEKEDRVIKMLIKSNSENIHYAFNKASYYMKKTPKQIKNRWYHTLRKDEKLFVTASGDSNHYNTKNVLREKPRPDMRININKSKRIIVKFKN